MFPFHRGDELFEIPSTTHPDYNNINITQQQNQQDHYHNNLLLPMAATTPADDVSFQIPPAARNARSKSSAPSDEYAPHFDTANSVRADNDNTAKSEGDRRKVLHREIERQRRQEMSNLYSSLRSQLPVEYIKGKRSISDHMNEAVNYIKHQQNHIKKLSIKRDELRISTSRLSNDIAMNNYSPFGSSGSGSIYNIQVSKCWGGVEIVVTRGFIDPNAPLPISKVLHTLQEDGFNVHGYVSTILNDNVVYTIQAQVWCSLVGDDTSPDLPHLEQKLFDVLSSSLS